jgi:hypothetical protein
MMFHLTEPHVLLPAHRLDKHSMGLSKAATKQNRTVEIELNFARPTTGSHSGRRRGFESDYDQVTILFFCYFLNLQVPVVARF